MHELILLSKAKKQLKKLPKEIQYRIGNALERIKIRPYSYVERIIGTPYFRLRVGKYRLILNIINNKLIIYVIKIAYRKDIYKSKI